MYFLMWTCKQVSFLHFLNEQLGDNNIIITSFVKWMFFGALNTPPNLHMGCGKIKQAGK